MCLSVVYAFKLPAIAQFLESQLIFLSHRFDTLDCCAARDTIFVHSDFQVTNFFSIKWSRRENIEIECVFSYCGLCFFLSVQKFESNSIFDWFVEFAVKFYSRVCKHLTVFYLLFSEFLLHKIVLFGKGVALLLFSGFFLWCLWVKWKEDESCAFHFVLTFFSDEDDGRSLIEVGDWEQS